QVGVPARPGATRQARVPAGVRAAAHTGGAIRARRPAQAAVIVLAQPRVTVPAQVTARTLPTGRPPVTARARPTGQPPVTARARPTSPPRLPARARPPSRPRVPTEARVVVPARVTGQPRITVQARVPAFRADRAGRLHGTALPGPLPPGTLLRGTGIPCTRT